MLWNFVWDYFLLLKVIKKDRNYSGNSSMFRLKFCMSDIEWLLF